MPCPRQIRGRVGLELATNALKGRCSTIELPTLSRRTRNLKRTDARSRFFTEAERGERGLHLGGVVAGLGAPDEHGDFAGSFVMVGQCQRSSARRRAPENPARGKTRVHGPARHLGHHGARGFFIRRRGSQIVEHPQSPTNCVSRNFL